MPELLQAAGRKESDSMDAPILEVGGCDQVQFQVSAIARVNRSLIQLTPSADLRDRI